MASRPQLDFNSIGLGILAILSGMLSSAAAQAPAQPQRPTVVIGPSAVYGRGFSPSLVRGAGFSYQAGYAPPAVVPNLTVQSYQPAFRDGQSFSSGPVMPYGAVVYGSTYPGYGFGFGSGYGALGYNFNYPGTTIGYGYLGRTFPAAGTGYVAPTWYYQQMQGYYR